MAPGKIRQFPLVSALVLNRRAQAAQACSRLYGSDQRSVHVTRTRANKCDLEFAQGVAVRPSS